MNQEVEKFNEEVTKMQAKVKINVRSAIPEGVIPEVALMRLTNHREPKLDDGSASPDPARSTSEMKSFPRGDQLGHDVPESVNSLENFLLEEIPAKIILIDQRQSEDTHLIAYHSGKTHFPKYLTVFYRGPI